MVENYGSSFRKDKEGVLRFYCPCGYAQRSRGWGEGPILEFSAPPPRVGAPRLWSAATRRDELVMTKSLPSSPVRAAAGAVLGPYGTGYPAPRRTLPSVGGRRHTPSSFRKEAAIFMVDNSGRYYR